MLDSPFLLLFIGISAAGAIASYTARRRRRSSASPPLSSLSDQDLATLLAALRTDDPTATGASITAQRLASQISEHPVSGRRTATRMREADNLQSVRWAIEQDHEVRRRITVLVIEEIERRHPGAQR